MEQKGSGLAITSLVLGIVSCLCLGPLCGIPAIILGIIALCNVRKGVGAGKGMAITGIVTGSLGSTILCIAILAGMLLPALSSAREKARRISCTSNLKQIGLAIRMYSQDNKDSFPDKSGAEGLEMLRAGGYLGVAKMYTCPSTTTTATDGETLTEENVSYVYVGGHTESDSVDAIVAYDKPNNHNKYGNVLFVDGHVQGYAGANWMGK